MPSIGSSSDLEPLSLDTQPISEYEVELPAIWEMHGASSLTDEAEVVSWRGEDPAMLMPHPSGRLVPLNRYSDGETPQDSIESVIVRRGSARRFSHESITLRELSTVLEKATQGIPADFLGQPGAALPARGRSRIVFRSSFSGPRFWHGGVCKRCRRPAIMSG